MPSSSSHPAWLSFACYLIGAVVFSSFHHDLGGFKYRHHNSQSNPCADRGYSSISKLSYLMLSNDGEMTLFLFSLILESTGSALKRRRGHSFSNTHGRWFLLTPHPPPASIFSINTGKLVIIHSVHTIFREHDLSPERSLEPLHSMVFFLSSNSFFSVSCLANSRNEGFLIADG